MCKYLIYGLIDPETRMIRYVGKSSSGLKRPRSHKYGYKAKKSHCASWVKSLYDKGLKYEIVALECTKADSLIDAERWWIAYGRCSNWPLTNLTEGGQGLPVGFKFSPENIALRKLRKVSNRTRQLISERLSKRHVSESTRQKLRDLNKGRIISEDTRKKISEALTGKPRPKDVMKKLHQGNVGRKRSAETRKLLSVKAKEREARKRNLKEIK